MTDGRRPCSRRRFLRRASAGGGGLAALATAGCLGIAASPADRVRNHEGDLRQFADLSTTLSAGYGMAAAYVRTAAGPIGVPFVDPSIEDLDPTTPQAILYGLREDGQFEPLGCKWFVPAGAVDEPPSLFGKRFRGPVEGHAGVDSRHYALTVWPYRENPDGLFAPAHPRADPPAYVEELDPVWEALGDLRWGQQAGAAGYTNTERCVATPRGGYGVPFVSGDAGGTNPERPPVLLYWLTPQWSYRLVGAEWYVPADETDEPPTLFDQRFHGPMASHSPEADQPRHYGLHAWLFRGNPEGLFATFNPVVRC